MLWLEARWARPHGGRLRVVVRPTGAEYFGHDHTLTRRFDLGGWPVPAEAWGERGSGDLLQRLLTLDPAAFPALKLVSAREDELRVVLKCAKADTSGYRVLRRARFLSPVVDPAFVDETVRVLRGIEQALGVAPVLP